MIRLYDIAEAEFPGHPDVFATRVVSRFVDNIANEAHNLEQRGRENAVHSVRIDSGLHAAEAAERLVFTFGGQINAPEGIDLREQARRAVRQTFDATGYLKEGAYHPSQVEVATNFTTQSDVLNGTTQRSDFADSCLCSGFYYADSHGIDGISPALHVARTISDVVFELSTADPHIWPDGKVYVVRSPGRSFGDLNIDIAVGHSAGVDVAYVRDTVREYLLASGKFRQYHGIEHAALTINEGEEFNPFFLSADFGLSKAKDGVLVHGGDKKSGSDGIWGKCLFKASSTAYPYAFALSRVVAEATGAQYASVFVHPKYGRDVHAIGLNDVQFLNGHSEHDPALNIAISAALTDMPRDLNTIREVLGMPVSVGTYRVFNDPLNFHASGNPWKRENAVLENAFGKRLAFYRRNPERAEARLVEEIRAA